MATASVSERPARESTGVEDGHNHTAWLWNQGQLCAGATRFHSVDHHTLSNTRPLDQRALHMREFSVALTYPGLSDHEDFVRSLRPRHPCLASDPSHFPQQALAVSHTCFCQVTQCENALLCLIIHAKVTQRG